MPSNPNLQRIIHQTLYQLKHWYGVPVDIYKLDSADTDYRTGSRSASVSKTSVRLAVVLPADSVRKFFQGISYISESKPFASPGGPGWDQDTRGFVFDGRDLLDFEWELEDWIVYDGKKYEVFTIEALEYKTGWLIVGKRARGTDPEQIIDVNIVDTINADSKTIGGL